MGKLHITVMRLQCASRRLQCASGALVRGFRTSTPAGFRTSAPLASDLASAVDTTAKEAAGLRTAVNIPSLAKSTRLRKSPYFERTLDYGVADYTVYNRMLMPIGYNEGPEVEYKALTEDVAIWDVGAERQVEVVGPDASHLAQLLTCRNLTDMKTQTCRYALMCNEDGIVLNDPVLLKLAEDRFWFSIADSDALLWAQAQASARGLDVRVFEPDVSPLALQGPKALPLMGELFGLKLIEDINYFHFREVELEGIPLLIARSGWSPEYGFELYLKDHADGSDLWDIVWKAGEKFNIRPGAPNQQRRVEGGMLSFGGDTYEDTNPLEMGLPKKFCNPFGKHEFIGKKALQKAAGRGVSRRFCGIKFDKPLPITDVEWRGQALPVLHADAKMGDMTVVTYSPRFGTNLGLATVSNYMQDGDKVAVKMANGELHTGKISKVPFPDKKVDALRPENSGVPQLLQQINKY